MTVRNTVNHPAHLPSFTGFTAMDGLHTEDFALQALDLKWERVPEPCHDYLFFLRRNATSTLLATSTSNSHSDHVTEVWSIADRSLLTRLQTPNTQSFCFDWLPDDSFVTGGQDNTLSLWREGAKHQVRVPQGMQSHRDWIRSVGVDPNGQWAVTGDIDSCIGRWDLGTATLQSFHILPGQADLDVNAVIEVAYIPSSPSSMFFIQRSGSLVLCDYRTRELFLWKGKAHQGRGSSVKFMDNEHRIVTSARGSELKLWDIRSLSHPNTINSYLTCYSQHKSEHLPLSFDFLLHDKYIATGSDDSHVYIYETLTGDLKRKVKLGTGQIQGTCAEEKGALSFFVSFLDSKYMGLVDTQGDTIAHAPTSTEQIKENFSKAAWDTALSKYTDHILTAIRSLPGGAPMGNGNWIEAVRRSDQPTCKELAANLSREYESQLHACTPSLVRELDQFFREQEKKKIPSCSPCPYPESRTARKGELAPPIKSEKQSLRRPQW